MSTMDFIEAQSILAGHFLPNELVALDTCVREIAREEIARSRAPVGEDAMMPTPEELASGIAIRKIEAADFYAPAPPAKDTGEGEALADRIAAVTSPHRVVMVDLETTGKLVEIARDAGHYIDELRGFLETAEADADTNYKLFKATECERDEARATIADLEARLAEAKRNAESWEEASRANITAVRNATTQRIERERDEARSSLETAESRYRDEHAIVDRVWKALGVTTYEEAGGKEISQLVAEWKARAEAAESSLETAERRIGELEAALAEGAVRAALFDYLAENCSYSYGGDSVSEPSPPEFGISWSWQATTPDRPRMLDQLHADAFAYFDRYVNEMDPGDEPTEWDRQVMAHRAALTPDARAALTDGEGT